MKIRSKIILGIACMALIFGSVGLVKFNKGSKPTAKPVEPLAPCVVEIGDTSTSLTYDPNDAAQSQTQKSWIYKFYNDSSDDLLIKLNTTPSLDNMSITYGYSQDEEADANNVTEVYNTYKDKVLATNQHVNVYIIVKVVEISTRF